MIALKSFVAAILAFALIVLVWRGYVQWHLPVLAERYGAIVNFATLTRSAAPHDHLRALGEDAPNARSDAPPLVVHVPPARVAQAIEALFGAKILTRSADGRDFALVDQTKLLGFPDFVTLSVREDPNGARVLAYSASVYGHGDFGANHKRIEAWFALLEAKLNGG
jgi:hypothetical protein